MAGTRVVYHHVQFYVVLRIKSRASDTMDKNSTIKGFKKLNGGIRETVQFSRVLAVLMEDRNSVPGTNIRQFIAVHYSTSLGSYILF